MPKIQSLEELRKTREEAKRDIKNRESISTKITIGMGTCGIAVGAQNVKNAIIDELEKKKIDAEVIDIGCIGKCSEEPLVTIKKSGQSKITYRKINVEKVPKLIEEQMIKDNVIKDWILKR